MYKNDACRVSTGVLCNEPRVFVVFEGIQVPSQHQQTPKPVDIRVRIVAKTDMLGITDELQLSRIECSCEVVCRSSRQVNVLESVLDELQAQDSRWHGWG